ncbi:MAG: DUF1365 domain-containing protein [Gammaproteobacteria bacterium]
MKSCIYKGTVGHTRFTPRRNEFRYSMFMMLLDLDELDTLFDKFWLWSARRVALARFRRSDHYGDPQQPLAETIRDLVKERTGKKPQGSIRLLAHLSYFGYCFNPISVYYCFDQNEQLENIVLQVSNTPWGEQHCYVLSPGENLSDKHHHYRFNKSFHVSPFMPMDMEYSCRLTPPEEILYFSLDNYRDEKKVFASDISLRRHEINHRSMAMTLLRDPFMTFRVVTLIHWQAFILWLKRMPFYDHPGNLKPEAAKGISNHE